MNTTDITETLRRVKTASRRLTSLTESRRNELLLALADELVASTPQLIEANALDLAKMERTNPLYDRMLLTPARLEGIASDMRHVAGLPSPLGEEIERRTLPNGLLLRRVRVPFGVIGVIYEARPNVTFDVFALCFKSGNACVLKGGSDAEHSNAAIIALIHRARKGRQHNSPERITERCTIAPFQRFHYETAVLFVFGNFCNFNVGSFKIEHYQVPPFRIKCALHQLFRI